MRKPLAALSLALCAGLGASQAADVLAAPAHSNPPNPPTTGKSSFASSASRPSNSVSGAQIVQTALQYLGYPYTATGNSPATGFSCIGFVSYVYRQNGISLPGDLGNALAFAPQVPFSALQPGDILYFQNTVWAGLSHAAIYLGGGRFVHAEWYGYGVRISSFNNDSKDGNYWIGKYMTANRPWAGPSVAPVVANPTGSVTTPSTTAVTKVASGPQAVVTVSSLNVRASPKMTAGVREVLPQGSSVTILGKRNGWYRVQLQDGTIGWVIGDGIGRGSAPAVQSQVNPNIGNPTAPTRISTPATGTHRSISSTVSGLRVHASPSMVAPVVTSIDAGERVQVLARSNGWIKVRTSTGQVGWVMGAYTTGHRKAAAQPTYNTYAAGQPKTVARNTSARGGSRMTAGVRIHTRPGLNAPVVGTTVAGSRVQVLGRSGAWVLIRLANGTTGYVYGSYVR